MTDAQSKKVLQLALRFGVDGNEAGYITYSDSLGLPTGWIGLEIQREGRPPYVLGISPEGDSHS